MCVLTVDGDCGGATHTVRVPADMPIPIRVDASPGGPSRGRFVLYAWIGEPAPGERDSSPLRHRNDVLADAARRRASGAGHHLEQHRASPLARRPESAVGARSLVDPPATSRAPVSGHHSSGDPRGQRIGCRGVLQRDEFRHRSHRLKESAPARTRCETAFRFSLCLRLPPSPVRVRRDVAFSMQETDHEGCLLSDRYP
jgi:hypothetical protein